MKYISMVFAILFCLSFTAPSMANDETQNNEQAPNINKLFEDMFRLPSFVDCGPPEKVLEMVEQYKEQELVAEELKNSGKPEEIAKKISLGKMNKFKEENALLSQAWVMEPKKKVQDIVKELSITDLKIKEFFRIKIGE